MARQNAENKLHLSTELQMGNLCHLFKGPGNITVEIQEGI